MNPLLDPALGREAKVQIHNPNGTTREIRGALLGYDLTVPTPYVVLGAPSNIHAQVVILGPGALVTFPHTVAPEHPGLATGPDRVTHPGLQ